jgi:DoxX-like family
METLKMKRRKLSTILGVGQFIEATHGDGRRVEIVEREDAGASSRAATENNRLRTIAYWGATGLVTIVPLFAAFAYLTTAPQAVENFRHVGYPQQLRVLLGIAKLAGAIVLFLPRLPMLKEWAYAGFTFMWIAATVAHYLAGDKPLFLLPVALIAALALSYLTRPATRRVSAEAMLS